MTVDVYPVGWLSTMQQAWRATRCGHPGYAALRVWSEAALTIRWARRRQWRSVKNTFNGYLAEPTPFPAHLTRCGSGWTRRRALRSLQRHGYTGPVG